MSPEPRTVIITAQAYDAKAREFGWLTEALNFTEMETTA